MSIVEIILNKDKQNLFLRTDKGNFILTFGKQIYFDIVLFIAEKQKAEQEKFNDGKVTEVNGVKDEDIDIELELVSKKRDIKRLEIRKDGRSLDEFERYIREYGTIKDHSSFLQYWRKRFCFSYKEEKKKGYLSLHYADSEKVLDYTNEADEKIGNNVCKQLFSFDGTKHYWIGDRNTTKIDIIESGLTGKQLAEFTSFDKKTVSQLIHSKGACVVLRELNNLSEILKVWSRKNICRVLLSSARERISHQFPGDNLIKFIQSYESKNEANKLTAEDIEELWYTIRAKDHELLRKAGIDPDELYSFIGKIETGKYEK